MASQTQSTTQANRNENNNGWIAWSILSAAVYLSYFHRVAPAVLVDGLMSEFNAGGTEIGFLASITFYIYMVMQIPTGLLVDAIGPRKTVAVGSLVAGIGALIFSSAPNLPLACAGRFFVGLGISVAFISALKAQALWFKPTSFATISGVLAIIGALGNITAATPLATAADAFGWRAVIAASGIACFVVALLIWFFVKDDDPQESSEHKLIQKASRQKAMRKVLRNRDTWFCSLMHFGWFGTFFAFVGLWGVPYLMHVYGLDRHHAANTTVWMSLAYTAGAFFYGAISDRLGGRRKPLLITSAIIFLGAWLCITLISRPSIELATTVLLVGSFASSATVLCFAVVKEANPPEASGFAMSLTNSGILCTALLQPILGLILDTGWQGEMLSGARIYPLHAYQTAFWAFIAVGVAALTAAILVREASHANHRDENLSVDKPSSLLRMHETSERA